MIKGKDLYLVIVVLIISTTIAIVVSNALFKTQRVKTRVEVVEPITNDFPTPSDAYFNKNSLDLTQIITINPSDNQQPFNNKTP